MRYEMDAERHAAIFGTPERGDVPGRARKCRTCGDWHRTDKPWPHNCRPPRPPRNPNLATPQVTPPFGEFVANHTTGEVIGDRKARREYMERNGLTDYAEVQRRGEHWTEQVEERREIEQFIATAMETDTEYLSNRLGMDITNPERVDESGSLDDGTEIEVDAMEVVDGSDA